MTILNSGVPVIIDLHKFVVGSSFYKPTLTPDTLMVDIERAANLRGVKVKAKFCLEGATQGVRFWRVN